MVKQFVKRVSKNENLRRFLCWAGSLYIRLVIGTCRWRVVGADAARDHWARRRPFILCFWHGRLLMMPHCWPRERTIHMLISGHRDGQLIAGTVSHFGIETVKGSTTRGGARALRAMLQVLKTGGYVGITPDGPRGPRMRSGEGAVNVARMAGVPIIPATFGVRSGRVLGTWDRFLVALPFSDGVIVWGEPITVERRADAEAIETARLAVEDSLNAITAEADRLTRRSPVQPAPATGLKVNGAGA